MFTGLNRFLVCASWIQLYSAFYWLFVVVFCFLKEPTVFLCLSWLNYVKLMPLVLFWSFVCCLVVLWLFVCLLCLLIVACFWQKNTCLFDSKKLHGSVGSYCSCCVCCSLDVQLTSHVLLVKSSKQYRTPKLEIITTLLHWTIMLVRTLSPFHHLFVETIIVK